MPLQRHEALIVVAAIVNLAPCDILGSQIGKSDLKLPYGVCSSTMCWVRSASAQRDDLLEEKAGLYICLELL